MNKKTLFLLFAIAALLHLAFPLSMILRQEWTLKHGEQVLLRTQPVDPYDVLRGRYVALAFHENKIKQSAEGLQRRQQVYAQYRIGEDGFAAVTNLVANRPKGFSIPARVGWVNAQQVNYQFTFNRYFLNENIAPEAEAAYRRMNRRGKTNTWVQVRVLKGHAVIEDLMLAGKPVLDYLDSELTQSSD